MGKLIKILVALILLLIVAVAALPFFIDPNDYRDEIVAVVEENTGRKLTIDGELVLNIFPWIGIDIGKLSLGNAQGFGDRPFAAIDNASVKIKLMPLLAKEVVADTITLNGLQLNLAKNKKGETNWADLAGEPKADEVKDKDSPQGVGLKGLAIGGFEINNATINWQDDSTGQSYQVNNFQLNSGAIFPGEPVDLALALDLKSAEPKMDAHLTLDGTVAVDSAMEKLTVLPLKLTIDANGAPLLEDNIKAELSSNITVNLKTMDVDLANLSVGIDFSGTNPPLKTKMQLDSELHLDGASQQMTLAPLKISVDSSGKLLPAGNVQAQLSSDVSVNLKTLTVQLKQLLVSSGDLKLSGQMALLNLGSNPSVNGDLKLARFNLRRFLQSQKIALPEMSNEQALTAFNADIALKGPLTNLIFSKLDLGLDSTSITGTGKLAGNHVGFNLDIDQINVDHYLPKPSDAKASDSNAANKTADAKPAPAKPAPAKPAPAKTAKANAPAAPAADNTPLFPVETLRALDINGKLKIGKLIVNNLTAESVENHVVAKKGVITSTQKIGRFYKGNFTGKTVLNVANKTPRLSVNANLQKLQAGPLLQDLTQKDVMDGTGQFKMAITSTGNTVTAIKKALGGTLSFRFENGAVKGFNLAKMIRETKAKFEGKSLPASREPEQTDFSELSGSAKITRGVLNNQDLSAKSPFLRVNGAGKVDLVKEMLDYTVQATIVSTAKGQGGEALKDLAGLNIPVKLKGPFTAPDYSVDWGKVLLSSQKAKVDEKIEEKKQEVKKKLEDKLKDKLGDKLKGLF